MTESLLVGVDAGATSTRVAVHTLDGRRVGYARAGAGNPTAHGLAKAVASVEAALGEALGSLDGARVVGSMAGVAGHVEEMVPELTKLWAAHGITTGPRYVADVTIGYAAGTSEPDGSLLLSGTGAVACQVVNYELGEIADGLGWLLGDAGSGFWIGRQAVKAVIEALDRGMPVAALSAPAPSGTLARLVGEHFLGAERFATPRAAADRIVRRSQADPMRLAAVSSLVSEAAAAGDPLAVKIAQEAAHHLVTTLRRIHVSGPVVLAGSVLTSDGPVRSAVTELLADETVTTAADAAGAAAWLAARPLLTPADATSRHATFTGGA
ncbi:BadF-type ATPase [Nonomuraea solani]|uniref:BadF-type ATPase n=1 Tax=Nonomuraea solani TaxID=1144553 RepID=A0A1H5TA75_9ACTN|nr:BadF/BadG/BcrA/BcrD ATPase family protein [Nonomuraea solani]SEF59723.1 BadF-type ATPase [Nonomuraea solani]